MFRGLALAGKVMWSKGTIWQMVLVAMIITGVACVDWGKVVGPDDAVPLGSVLPITNNDQKTEFVDIVVNATAIVRDLRLGQSTVVDLTRIYGNIQEISFSAKGYAHTSSGGLQYLGCEPHVVRISELQYGRIRTWGVSNVRLGRNDC
ncbi:MAG: hypothetical protein A3B14_02625 [Candidatus Zambryskibacteria bacterium RIFCSPLOWO2_01_FULL_45_21]|uniref:Uncharacterized protein n=1 Tax=Candidatus Zambryskibacteria bacterium RIFCSPLOWO2_01_FULL_45_21 TaxID=1802761 RepID=A0A1G2U4C8_9BACT|nr:MAG: hypothetical protein A3B14_02625 [Candidatus Zambryskibacteria bacterium RIFCSPLOWO2_01_FULL_45_21]